MIVFLLKRFAGLFIVLFLTTILGCSDENQSNPSDVSGTTTPTITSRNSASEVKAMNSPRVGRIFFLKRTVRCVREEGDSCAVSAFLPIGIRA